MFMERDFGIFQDDFLVVNIMCKLWLVKSVIFWVVLGLLVCDNCDIYNIVQLCFCYFMSNNLKGIRFVLVLICYVIVVKDFVGDLVLKCKDFFLIRVQLVWERSFISRFEMRQWWKLNLGYYDSYVNENQYQSLYFMW